MGALIGRQVRYVNDRPDLDRAATGHGNPRRDGDRLVEIARIDQEVAAQLLLGLRERAVGHYPFALAYPDAGRRGGRLERGGGEILTRGTELVRQLGRLAVTLLPLDRTQRLLVQVDQQHVSHQCASVRRRLSLREVLSPCPPLPSGEGECVPPRRRERVRTTPRQSPRRRERAPSPTRPRREAGHPAVRGSGPARTQRIAGTAVAAR